MKCEEIRPWLMAFLDGEIEQREKSEVEKHLAECENCRREYESFARLKEVTNSMRFADLSDQLWAGYWNGVYRRVERGAGWILLSIGAIVLLAFGAFQFFKELLTDPNVPLVLKIGVSTCAFGAIVLLVSIIRERLFLFKTERYREVER
jgi:predicted anti-sigma-YlaC factor YlaD